jgi:hypothetical protein
VGGWGFVNILKRACELDARANLSFLRQAGRETFFGLSPLQGVELENDLGQGSGIHYRIFKHHVLGIGGIHCGAQAGWRPGCVDGPYNGEKVSSDGFLRLGGG